MAAVCAVLGVAAFLSTAQYTRKARVSGHLVPDRGVLRVAPPQGGTVLLRQVSEGQSVKAGDILFVLALDSSAEQLGEGLKRNLAERERSLGHSVQQQQRLTQQEAQGLLRRMAGLKEEEAQLQQEARLQAERLALTEQALQRLEALARDQFVSSAQVQTKREEVLGLQAQLQALSRQRETLHREWLALQAQYTELPLRAEVQQGELARDLAALQALGLETESRRRLVLRAPSDGQISTVLAEPGQTVPAGMVLANLLPAETRMLAHLYAPSSAIGFVHAQQQVQLRYQAFPYQKFGHQFGEVLQVTRTPLPATELAGLSLPAALSQGAGSEPLYRITVALQKQTVQAYGQEQALTPGMQLEADVLLERRRLIEWIFEPLLSLAHRV
ncbi:HlyD family efflux transporter periplasmic adaptor subunit [Paucibacter sp. APW11]|uniref:HlyD family efflux transporter periplasmic adaptor subunit n=1 Tax=Roseateles aquae TaxID=3077235 RepID=A0ABU3PGE6_9BURK|nr:HlyD family efflux transporter periplasmic adaptor subunit [Paucibacter sp. APW11]MDT9001614.1 HlyD family efflux transporter periplasmic adaptor subunit [Paucibacter sp. APW11]